MPVDTDLASVLDARVYACKVFERSIMTRRMIKNIFEETSSFRRLGDHPNIVNYIAQYKTLNRFYVFLEHCNCGDLESLMNNGLCLGEAEVQYFARELLQALKLLSDAGVVHRDIKTANILLHVPPPRLTRTLRGENEDRTFN